MIKRLKRLTKAFFTLNKGEQRAIIILLVMALCVSVFNLLIPLFVTHKQFDHHNFIRQVEEFREEQKKISDSIETVKLQNRGELDLERARQKLKPFEFDPNDLPVELWKKIGLTDKQIGVIKNYENKGGIFLQKEDLKRMYCISEAEYQVLEPYIIIKSTSKTINENKPEKRVKEVISGRKEPAYKLVDLNSATAAELTENLHLPEWLAGRVVKYRNLLGGFAYVSQLAEVYGFDSLQIDKLGKYISIDLTQIKQIDLNNSTFKEILHHPYISYEITKRIVNYREKHGKIKSVEELVDSNLISKSLFIKIKSYLRIKADQLPKD